MKNTNYLCPECYVEGKDQIINPIENPNIVFCPSCGWLIDLVCLEMQPYLHVKKPVKIKRRIEWLMGFEWNKGKTEEELKQNIIDMYKEERRTIAEGAFDELVPEYFGEVRFDDGEFDKEGRSKLAIK